MDRLRGKVAFITGAGGILGSASAELFAREGARVAVIDAVAATAEATARRIVRDGGEALALQVDVTDEAQVRDAVAATVTRWGTLDALFNNAGIMPHQDRSVLEMDAALWDQIYATNVRGGALCCKYAIPHIIAAGGGAVINMGSFVAFMGSANAQEGYGASRGAVVAFTRSLAVQFGRHNIRANALCPGPVETAHVRALFPDEDARRRRLDRIPLGRFGRPEDVAELALYLASDVASWLTGQAIVLDGGISCHYL